MSAPHGGGAWRGPPPAAGWKASFTTGKLTEAKAVDELLTTGQQEWKGNLKTYATGKFDRSYLATWTSPAGARRVRGVPRVHLTLTPAGQNTTLVAYLFDLARTAPHASSRTSRTPAPAHRPARPSRCPGTFRPPAYGIAADLKVMLVINAKDELYSDANQAFATLHLGSTDGTEAYVELPLG